MGEKVALTGLLQVSEAVNNNVPLVTAALQGAGVALVQTSESLQQSTKNLETAGSSFGLTTIKYVQDGVIWVIKAPITGVVSGLTMGVYAGNRVYRYFNPNSHTIAQAEMLKAQAAHSRLQVAQLDFNTLRQRVVTLRPERQQALTPCDLKCTFEQQQQPEKPKESVPLVVKAAAVASVLHVSAVAAAAGSTTYTGAAIAAGTAALPVVAVAACGCALCYAESVIYKKCNTPSVCCVARSERNRALVEQYRAQAAYYAVQENDVRQKLISLKQEWEVLAKSQTKIPSKL